MQILKCYKAHVLYLKSYGVILCYVPIRAVRQQLFSFRFSA
ncbi:hypothetical protein CAEBREN_13658 [Caenorhabditis brenneri]|uniref:Uncharacterized protein n=1 Tax=Caenorhabditis brenneri TaxID=135651 RepID=G0PDX2_CAEBE|nr:hypothetical protein CAEBREN_13658 [Caenorhabditis brenneri]